MIHGRECIIKVNGVAIAASRDLVVDRKTETIEVCSPVDGPDKDYIACAASWEASTSGLYADEAGAKRLRKIHARRQKLNIRYRTGRVIEQGTAILTSLQETGNMNGLMKFSAKLQGCGKLDTEGVRVMVRDTEHMDVDGYSVGMYEGDWSFFQDDEGCVISELNKAHSWTVKNTGNNAIVVLNGCMLSEAEIAEYASEGNSYAVNEETYVHRTIGAGEEMEVEPYGTGRTFVIIPGKESAENNAELRDHSIDS